MEQPSKGRRAWGYGPLLNGCPPFDEGELWFGSDDDILKSKGYEVPFSRVQWGAEWRGMMLYMELTVFSVLLFVD